MLLFSFFTMFQYLGLTLLVFLFTWLFAEETTAKDATSNLESILIRRKNFAEHQKRMEIVLPLIENNRNFLENHGQGWLMESDQLILHGIVVHFNDNNEMVKTSYSHGQKHGVQSVFYPKSNQLKQTTEFRNNLKDGHQCNYNKNGTLLQSTLYALGKILQENQFDIHGPISEKNYNFNGEKHGNYITLFPNGPIQYLYSYRDDKLHGQCFANYENGKTKWTAIFKNGQPTESHFEYFENGTLKKHEIYNSEDNLMIEYFQNGTVEYAGSHKRGIRHGQGIQFTNQFGKQNTNPFRYMGEFFNGFPIQQGI